MVAIDPHAHTVHSDGTCTATQLVTQAKAAGLDYVGLTDHDTTAGWDEAIAAAKSHGMGLIPGAEVSSQWQGQSVHILAFLFEPQDPGLLQMFTQTIQGRVDRMRTMVERMQPDFPDLSFDRVLERSGGAVGRPHLADELIELGHFPNRAAVFKTALANNSPYYEPQTAPDVIEAVKTIRNAGGVPVLAHPFGSSRDAPLPTEVVREMVDAGLLGLEVNHPEHGETQREQASQLARSFGLFETGGSDFHGLGKPNRLGQDTMEEATLAQIAAFGKTKAVHP